MKSLQLQLLTWYICTPGLGTLERAFHDIRRKKPEEAEELQEVEERTGMFQGFRGVHWKDRLRVGGRDRVRQ